MAQFILPIVNDPTVVDFTFQVELDSVTFSLTHRFNFRDNFWYLDIQASDLTPILMSQKAVVNYPIGWRQRYNSNMPAGSLQYQDTSGQGLDPGLNDLGARVQLLYFDKAEIAAQLAGTGVNVSG